MKRNSALYRRTARVDAPSGSSRPTAAMSCSAGPTSAAASQPLSVSAPPSVSVSRILPHYDVELRELSVTGQVILRLPVQARSLAAVLTALQVAGWALRVPKPLSGRPGGNDPHHLAIAAYKLNDRQELIDFHADDGALRWNWRRGTPSLA